MGASSVTGVGIGDSNKFTTKELSILANAPAIVAAGHVESTAVMSSPPSNGNTVEFPNPLQGSASNYVVMLTSQNGGIAYVNELNENDDGNFTGFSFVTEADCNLMYLVANAGNRPVVV